MNKRPFILFLLVFIYDLTFCQSVTYTELTTPIANPERGFYHHTETHSGDYSFLSEATLKGYRETESITQILRVFYLEAFRTSPISETYLNNIRKDFATIRKAGLKTIIRFAYTQSSTAPYNDATPEMVLLHISQLKPVIRENADVIATWQAGFIGAWGEWYYTDHFANGPGQVRESDWVNRKKVIDALLDALPSDRSIQIRTPGYKFKIYNTTTPISASEAFSGSDYARVGHHNDCFVASSSDYGTYVNPDIEKPFLEKETLYVPMGGETCNLAPPYSDCPYAENELQRFHWSYLNRDYHTSVLNTWSSQGCFDEIELKLGYRHRLLNSSFTTQTKPMGKFDLTINLVNDGYANFYNKRNFEVILRNDAGEEYVFNPDSDPRKWPIGTAHTIQISAGIPQNITPGNYKIYLNMPDPYFSIKGRPEYSARFANVDTWDAALGYNDLGANVNISSSNDGIEYSGNDFFNTRQSSNTIRIDGSDKLHGGASASGIVLFWPPQSTDLIRAISRKSSGSENYELVASIAGDALSWLDASAPEGTNSYQYYLINPEGRTIGSSELSLETSPGRFPEILTDGSDTDWGIIRPVLASSGSDLKALRVFFGSTKLHLLAYGATAFDILLDSDRDKTTGLSGFDYKITQDGVFTYSGTSWTKTGDLSQSTVDQIREIEVPLSIFGNLGSNLIVPIMATFDNAVLTNSGLDIYPVVRSLPTDAPAGLMVRNSASIETRLVIEWSKCSNCEGYLIERSEDGESFEEIANPGKNESLMRDDDLSNHTVYYYRMATYNAIGKSDYSEIVQARTGVKVLGVNPLADIKIYPNPVKDNLTISGFEGKIELYSLDGRKTFEMTSSETFSLKEMKPGLYLIRLIDMKGKESFSRVIKQ